MPIYIDIARVRVAPLYAARFTGFRIPQAEPAEFNTFPKASASRLGVGRKSGDGRP